ncbi:MAG: 50S ribosomal protein L31 [Phascolarctobacterium sp.]|nr:50S ribosomal protein L31 [Phascolarctobacterium sp.]MCD8174713.1 50S ribosomal protein L31 [Phascolarctobacterium sp.]
MKEKIHPKFVEAKATCACGNTFMTASVKPEIRVDVCSKCHPFYSGQQRNLAARGRVEKFNKRYNLEK